MYIEFSLNFLLFLLSQIVKLKTKKIKPFCFARAKYFRFVDDVAFCFPVCESPFFVVCLCMCFCVMRNLILLLFVVNCERFFIFLSLVWKPKNDHKITKIKKVKTCTEQHWRGNKSDLFSIVFMCSETDRIATMAHDVEHNRGFRINRNKREECWKMSRFY